MKNKKKYFELPGLRVRYQSIVLLNLYNKRYCLRSMLTWLPPQAMDVTSAKNRVGLYQSDPHTWCSSRAYRGGPRRYRTRALLYYYC